MKTAKKVAAKKPCRHRFRFAWSSGRGAGGRKIKMPKSLGSKIMLSKALTFGFRCMRCGEDVERKATPGERKFYGRKIAWESKPNIHTVLVSSHVWHVLRARHLSRPRRTAGNPRHFHSSGSSWKCKKRAQSPTT